MVQSFDKTLLKFTIPLSEFGALPAQIAGGRESELSEKTSVLPARSRLPHAVY